MKIIGVIGSRRRNNIEAYKKVYNKFFEIYEKGDWICSGGCPKGADKYAEDIAKKHGIPILIFYPDYETYGSPAALFIRNSEVAKHSNVILACVAHDRTGGTEDTIKKFLKDKSQELLYTV